MSTPTALVQELWNHCNILRDDDLSYGDYVEQLTFLLFLKWRMSSRGRRSTSRHAFPSAQAALRILAVWQSRLFSVTLFPNEQPHHT